MDKVDKYKAFYSSYEWRKVRYDALKAADGKCQLCGRGKHNKIILNVDHIIPLRKDWKRRADITNLQVLCHECNHGKGNRDTTDWRPLEPIERVVKVKKKRRKKKKGKGALVKAKLKKKRAMERYMYGRMGAASGVRVVSIEDWIADKVKEAQQ